MCVCVHNLVIQSFNFSRLVSKGRKSSLEGPVVWLANFDPDLFWPVVGREDKNNYFKLNNGSSCIEAVIR